jgi:hypothetical protein
MNRTKNGFDTLSLADFIETLNTITGKMNLNPNFQNLQEAVNALITAKGEFLVLAQKASGGSKEDILVRDAKRESLVFQLRNLGNAVTAAAQGDMVILTSSGFPLNKEPTPTSPLVKPDAPKVYAGVSAGEINVVAKKQVGNERVDYMISTDPTAESSWKAYNSSKSKYLFTDLISGQRYYIKYALQGVRDQEVESDVVSYIAQ